MKKANFYVAWFVSLKENGNGIFLFIIKELITEALGRDILLGDPK